MTAAGSPAPRALVVTVVHRPGDARIAHRQLGALRDAGLGASIELDRLEAYLARKPATDTARAS